ncbi:hypothetical protein O159_03300 [Leifsonia xyli subsp. cynodontis DSM 46306]|jgi:hypothetical protein|uniref:DUF4232 domain-containing protein n=1 Tax=Leifsonia xyli subsp. cynodontis DSM 46306 TaxID=1389489 RepID=U3P513_LEIXC|nr:hypothetical protein [Leifsonia xyli]AGW40549.1 hypothetical protein O159_03300 [Leifsonia xyli subsp. cynodontis DSM 46306]
MSTFKNPVGPKPPAVYWRRRLVLFLALVAVVVAIVLIVVRLGSAGGEPAAPKAKTVPAATPTAGATSIPTSSASGRACNPAEVKVDAVTDQSSYAAGQLPQLSIAIANTGGSPCTIDAGTAQQVFTITSGSEVYWKSTDCQTEKVNADVLLQPGKTISSQAPITWDRTRSDPATCQAQRAQVPAGGASYHLETSVAGIVSQTSKQFVLQ